MGTLENMDINNIKNSCGRISKEEVREKIYKDKNIDSIVLGCTHYPFIKKEIFENELKKNKELKVLVDQGIIDIIDYDEYIDRKDDKEYQEYFKWAYEKMNRFDLGKIKVGTGMDKTCYIDISITK